VTGGLTRRMVVASGMLALVVGAAFAVLLFSIANLQQSEQRARQSEAVLVAANRLERLVIDIDSGQRGFLITGQDDVLAQWRAAQIAFPDEARALERLVAGDPQQERRAQEITQTGMSYIQDYSAPLVQAARRDPATARAAPAIAEDRRRIDAIRAEFDGFVAAEQDLALARAQQSDSAARHGYVAAGGGLVGSIMLIAVFATYLTRAIVRPVRSAAAMAGQLADGDLGIRLPEHGVGEIGVLERSFNTMARSLQNSREELAASRARIVAAADETRRRIERDLHDGIQQRLVSLVLDLRAAETAVPPALPELRTQLRHVTDGLVEATEDLRELARGIHPAILSEGGLAPALKALARRSVVPVDLDLDVPARLPEQTEVAAYYVVSEALTNAAKHAHASVAHVDARAEDGRLRVSIQDDGIGGATPGSGSGLVGLTDRAQALGGTITVSSRRGRGTVLLLDLPVGDR
jgi:signal transduction histidine kinase